MSDKSSTLDGLVSVKGYLKNGRPPEEVMIMEKAEIYGVSAVLFEASREGKPPVAQAFVFVSEEPADSPKFAETHRQLWSWGGVPLEPLRRKLLILSLLIAYLEARKVFEPDYFNKFKPGATQFLRF